MNKAEIDKEIRDFMHPTVYTGVKPLLLVAEELATKEHTGDIIDAVWIDWNDESLPLFKYITKFAVKGEIKHTKYHTPQEIEPFCDGLALPNNDNLQKMILHRKIKQDIKDVEAKRNALADSIQRDFDTVDELLKEGEELSFFIRRSSGDWNDPFCDINLEQPYKIVEKKESQLDAGEYYLQDTKSNKVSKYKIKKDFYAFIVGAKADMAGLQLKSESYKKKIETLKEEAREIFKSIEWLYLKDPRLISIKEKLSKHPFDDYFNYVRKGEERKLQAPDNLLQALELIVAKHMPKEVGPMGVKYLPIDNLLYLFHEVIPRAEALKALESCDVVHEPSGLLLGFEGKRELPPKFLVSLSHVAFAYKEFPSFIEACERYLAESRV